MLGVYVGKSSVSRAGQVLRAQGDMLSSVAETGPRDGNPAAAGLAQL